MPPPQNTPITISVTVRNSGYKPGRHAVLLFGVDVVRRITPEFKLLKGFVKTPVLQPNEAQTFQFTITPREDLSYYGVDRERVVEGGDFLFGVGHEVDCRKNPSQCVKLTLQVSNN